MRHLVFVATVDWFFISHRLPLAKAALEEGYEVTVVAKDTSRMDELRACGINCINVNFSRSGTNPIGELKIITRLMRTLRKLRPHVVHFIALKPVIYGGLISKIILKDAVKVYAVTGFGHLFSGENVPKVVQSLIRQMLRMFWRNKNSRVIVQNQDHREELLSRNLIVPDRLHLIEGAGVDLHEFRPVPSQDSPGLVVLPARMLIAKGVNEFAQAAKILRMRGRNERFLLIGSAGDDNPTSLSEADLRALEIETGVEWIGHQPDISNYFQRATLTVLPSYAEGMPKALIEAMACGSPIVTTDIPGCRQLVNSINGRLVPPKTAEPLADAIEDMLQIDLTAARLESRRLAEERFGIDRVVQKTLETYLPS